MDAQVLIVGAGPVGMVLALDLASRGVTALLVERQHRDHTPSPRCNHLSAHTLETFRRLGLANEIRDAGLPGHFPHDVMYATSLMGHELCRIHIPARNARFGTYGYADSDWPTPEPPHRCNQMYFEPILQRHVLGSPKIKVLYDVEIDEIVQNDIGVEAIGRNVKNGEAVRLKASYAIGCDGGSSAVRRMIGAEFEGDSVISRNRSLIISSDQLGSAAKLSPAWMTWFIQPDILGCLVALNAKDLWAFHFWMPPETPDFEAFDCDAAIQRVAGGPVKYTIVQRDDWIGRRLVASRFRDRRIFICGDAAHIWIPFAGYGMNAGIADAMTLSWLLAAVSNGWGAPALLDAFEAERQPVTEQVSKQAMRLLEDNMKAGQVRKLIPLLDKNGSEGDAARRVVGRFFYDQNVGQFAPIGLNFGSFYDRSTIIAYDGEPAPDYDLGTYRPSTVPGCRTPHIWLRDGASLFDRMGPEYTLLRFNPKIDVNALFRAAENRGVPLTLLDLDASEKSGVYDRSLILSRPDRHIAWRGDELPRNCLELVDLIRGARTTEVNRPLLATNKRQETLSVGSR